MNELRRLVQSDEPGARLLKAARAYHPPPAARRRVQRMLGLPVLSLGATLSAALASTSAKVLLVAAAVTATTGGAAVAYRAAVRNPVPVAPRSPLVKGTPAPAAWPGSAPIGAGLAEASDLVPAQPPHTRLDRPPAHRRAAATPRPRPRAAALSDRPLPRGSLAGEPGIELPAEPPPAVTPTAASPLPPSRLAAELELLEAVEAAIRKRRFGEALARLQEHRRAFPDGALGEEATVLRIAALFATNQRAVARAEAERFLGLSSGSPLADRVRSMLAADAEQAGGSAPDQGDFQ